LFFKTVLPKRGKNGLTSLKFEEKNLFMKANLQKPFIKQVKDISISSGISLALLGLGTFTQSCNSNNSSESYDDYETVESYSTGVLSYIKETEKGVFKITKEQNVSADSSGAVITYLNGTTQKLSTTQASNLIDKHIANHYSEVGKNNSLENVLLYGGLGYFLGKMGKSNYNSFISERDYASQDNNYTQESRRDTSRNRSSRSHYRSGLTRFYTGSSAYRSRATTTEHVNSSRTISSHPSGGHSGFFHSSSHSSFHS
jgi:hypothetical protein